jgi:UDP-N-acetylmuramate--alanine ligase
MTLTLAELKNKSVHFVGMGGAGMSGIARIMLSQGITVSGSDAKQSSVLTSLAALGAQTFVGHSASNLGASEVLVVSSAIDSKNPELVEAQNRGISILGRAEALALLMSESVSVAVAGTHGKTTTTSMLTVALQSAGMDPSFAIGGMINSAGTNAHLGTGPTFIAEADESDGSFIAYRPFGAIVTNLEWDHVDHFPDYASVLAVFHDFVNSIAPDGFLVACIDSPGVKELISGISRTDLRIITYGTEGEYSFSHLALGANQSSARISHNGRVLGELVLAIPGAHNVMNAIAALAAGLALGGELAPLLAGLSTFSGARRRFEIKGTVQGIRVIDDYGHHPTEVSVTLETARRFAGTGKVIAIFQPHRYSRTKAFTQEFAQALSLADRVFLLEIYPASEAPIPGVSALNIASLMNPAQATFEPSMIQVVEELVDIAQPGDVVLTLGAGDVNSLAPVILQSLTEKYSK